jgi:ribosomal protein L31E
MADKIERTYNVNLRKGFIRTPRIKKAKKAVSTLRKFIIQHMKVDEVKIGPKLNDLIWQHGIKNPPHHVKVTAVKEDKVARVELEGIAFKTIIPKKKEEKAAGLKGKLDELTKTKQGAEEKKDVKAEPKEAKQEEPKKSKPKTTEQKHAN